MADNPVAPLAHKFARRVMAYLSPEDLAAVRQRNAEYGAGICATHDFCDANVPMIEAFASLFGRDPEPCSDDDASLISAAWLLAKAAYFTSPATDDQLHAALEARGYVKEHNGGNTHIYRRGNVVVSGADGDLPSPHWFTIGAYVDWERDGNDLHYCCSDFSDEPGFEDQGGPLDIFAELDKAEYLAGLLA